MSNDIENISFLQKHWGQITSFLISYTTIIACWIRMEIKTNSVYKMVIDSKSGKPSIVFSDDCKKDQSNCQKVLLTSIEEIKTKQDMAEKLYREEITNLHKRIDETNSIVAKVPKETIDLLYKIKALKEE